MKLYRLNDGASHWIAANTQDEARALWYEMATLSYGMTEAEYLRKTVTLEERTEKQERKSTFHDQDGGTRPMWDVFLEAAAPTYLACSEW